MDEWQPIETAPKDGTPVLVLFEGKPHVSRWAAVFHPKNTMWILDHADRGNSNLVTSLGPELDGNGELPYGARTGPTHWMPIPPPPAIATEAAPAAETVQRGR